MQWSVGEIVGYTSAAVITVVLVYVLVVLVLRRRRSRYLEPKMRQVFVDRPTEWMTATDVHKVVGGLAVPLPIWPILMRLEREGFVDSEWEMLAPPDPNRHRRRFYRLRQDRG